MNVIQVLPKIGKLFERFTTALSILSTVAVRFYYYYPTYTNK
ncbi:hypothetical protein [Anaerobiospirillum succiniciproducens]|nr:hypothetical protein [Anaerobiospirillum succiniciproducens]